MKLVAILKDSFREARDRKIFAAMLILSMLLILFVFSISFRPVSLEDELTSATRMLTWAMSMDPHGRKPKFAIENFKQTNEPAERWKGDYQFDWVVKAEGVEKMRHGEMGSQRDVKNLMREMKFLKDIEVAENSSKDPKEVRFTVTTKGTTVDDQLAWRHEPVILFAVPLRFMHTSLREGVYFIENSLVGGMGAWVAVLVGVIVTASFIPNMLQKGAIELARSKPIHPANLLLYKYLGGLIFVFALTVFTVVGVWAAIGVRTGIWATGFLYTIGAITFYFALLYSVSTLVAVFTRSAVVAILLTIAIWFGLWVNGLVFGFIDKAHRAAVEAEVKVREMAGVKKPADATADDKGDADNEIERPPFAVPKWIHSTSHFFYRVLPRTSDLNQLTEERVARGLLSESEYKRQFGKKEPPPWLEVFGVTGAFIAVMLAVSCWKFSRTDY